MRVLRILVGTVAAVLVVTALTVELSALALATRAVRATVERCAPVDELEVTSVDRPAIAGFIGGELQDVRVRASGLQLGRLDVALVDARLPAVPVGWSRAERPLTAVADVTVTEESLTSYLDAVAPEIAEPVLSISPQGLDVGDVRVPFTLQVRPGLVDGDIHLVPTAGDPRLWSSLGLELVLDIPEPVELLDLRVGDGQVEATARVRFQPAGSRGQAHAAESGRGAQCPDLEEFTP